MEVAQNDETNPNMPSSCLSHASSMMNMKVSPPFHQSDNHPELGEHSRIISAPTNLRSTALGHPSYNVLPCHASVFAIVCLLFIVSYPSSISIDPETNAAQEPDDTVDDLAFAVELPGKHPPFEYADIAYSFPLMLALEIATATVYPISDA
jgi:hypothetical protein